MSGLTEDALVGFYRLWHGKLGIPGAGWLLRKAAPIVTGLQRYALPVPGIGQVSVDFSDMTAFTWMNRLLGEKGNEAGLETALGRALAPGMVFWDVGANAGTVTAQFAGEDRALKKIHAFEPNPRCSEMIRALFQGLPRVDVRNCGLSDIERTFTLHIPKADSTMASIAGPLRGDCESVEIDCFSGDALIENEGVTPPDVIKIDVEGHESEVIRGLTKTIREHGPTVFFEHLFLDDDAIRSLTPAGYVLKTVSDTDGTLKDGFDRSWGHNSVLVPGEGAA